MTPIVGMGAVCAAGTSVRAAFGPVARGDDSLTPLSTFATGLRQAPLCAQIAPDAAGILGSEAPNRTIALALCAAREAIGGLDLSGLRAGLVAATTVAGMTRSERFFERLRLDDSVLDQAAGELAFHEPVALSGELCGRLGLHGYHTLSTACSTGLHAIGLARRLVERGMYDVCLAVGADALSLLTVRGFASLLLIDPNGCRPFDKRRAGISLGEGAGAMLLASERACARLGREPVAFVAGWGASADAHHMSAPHPHGEGARTAVKRALDEAGLEPRAIGLIAAHGTATPDNDVAEIKAMREVFGVLPPFCSMKRTLGHTLAASGALEAVFAVEALRASIVPATGGFEEPDDAIGAVPGGAPASALCHVLKNSFGFGGNNAALILSVAG